MTDHKRTPEELASASFFERVYALNEKIFRPLIVMLAFSFAILTFLNHVIPDRPSSVDVPTDRLETARKYANENKRLFDEIAPKIDISALSLETQNLLAELAGSIAGTQSAIESLTPTSDSSWLDDLSSGLITSAHAQDTKDGVAVAVNWMRQGIVVFMIVCITILLIGFLVLYFKTTDPEKLKFADSMIRMIVGFYIGVVTGLLGIPPA